MHSFLKKLYFEKLFRYYFKKLYIIKYLKLVEILAKFDIYRGYGSNHPPPNYPLHFSESFKDITFE